jgi:TolB-like protein
MSERPAPSYTGDQPFFFVSYGHADAELVHPEMRWLQEAGFNLWYDEGIHVGSVWRKAIADALSGAAGMLFLATKSSVESDNCLKELNFVLDEEKPVFVVRLDDTKLSGLLRLSLADRQMLNRAEFDEKTYRSRLTQALSAVAKPTPSTFVDTTKASHGNTSVTSIGLQVLSAGDPETAFWAESLVDDLARLLGYRAFGVTTSHDGTKDLVALGRALDVSYVVSGNVRHADDRYRVNLKLTKGHSGAQVWGARYDERGDPIDAADAVGRAAAVDISTAVIDDERSRLRDADRQRLNAWELCIVASGLTINTARERDTLIGLLRRAVELDPNFALAQGMLAAWLSLCVQTMFSRQPEADIADALRHADHARSLVPNNPVIMQIASHVHRIFGDEALALDLARRANDIAGNDAVFGFRFIPDALFFALIQTAHEEEAIRLMLASRPLPDRALYTAYAALGRWDDALTWAQRAIATEPWLYLAWVEVANALAALDRLDEAREAMRRVTTMVPTFSLAYYEKGTRISYRNREKIVDSQLAGLRKLEKA